MGGGLGQHPARPLRGRSQDWVRTDLQGSLMRCLPDLQGLQHLHRWATPGRPALCARAPTVVSGEPGTVVPALENSGQKKRKLLPGRQSWRNRDCTCPRGLVTLKSPCALCPNSATPWKGEHSNNVGAEGAG